MARKRLDIDPDEIKLHQFVPYTVVALAYLGGSARKEPVIRRVGEMLKDQLKPCDWRLMCKGPHGQDYAPVGYTGRTWPVWEGKVSYSFKFAALEGLLRANNGTYTLTPEGMKYVAIHAESWLKAK